MYKRGEEESKTFLQGYITSVVGPEMAIKYHTTVYCEIITEERYMVVYM